MLSDKYKSSLARFQFEKCAFLSLRVVSIDLCHGTAAKVWSYTRIGHTTGKNKPSLVSAPIVRVTDQSTVKCHHFENCNFYKDLYGELICHTKPYNNRNFQIDGASRYFGLWLWQLVHLLIALSSSVFCFRVWPSFIGAALSVIKVYSVKLWHQ